MLSVTARRMQTHEGLSRDKSARIYCGFLIHFPVAGQGMIIVQAPGGHRMITTPVQRVQRVERVLGEVSSRVVYVETANSIYRLEIHDSGSSTRDRVEEDEGAVAT